MCVCVCVCVCVCGGGGGGGGTLTFSSYVGFGPASTVCRQKIMIGNIKHPIKYLKFLPRKNILILYIYHKKIP